MSVMADDPPLDAFVSTLQRSKLLDAGDIDRLAAQSRPTSARAFADAAGNLGDFMNPLMSHEFMHLWNVKRIRPAELWPYDYTAEQYTPLLWWSEGVTDYYADVSNLRAGLWTDQEFTANLHSNATRVDEAPEPWSVEDGSTITWIDEVFVGSDSTLVAPVTIGDGAYVAAGSTITDDLGPGDLGIARGRQHSARGWVLSKRAGTKAALAAEAAIADEPVQLPLGSHPTTKAQGDRPA